MQVNKKGKLNNHDIIDYVKIMYGLNVNNAMISYVRKDKGIQKKRNDSRTVTKNKVNRIINYLLSIFNSTSREKILLTALLYDSRLSNEDMNKVISTLNIKVK